MTAAVQPFDYEGNEIRVASVDGEPWFAAVDICDVLEVGNSRQALARLDEDEKGVISSDTPGGRQQLAAVNEAGMYTLVLTSRKSEAKAFKRWVTHEVLPAIRRTGSYGQPAGLSFEEMTSHVISELSRRIEEAQEKARELEAPARAWTGLSSADGDFTVSDAAKALARAGVETGPRKLYDWLDTNGWVFRRGGRWQAMQSAVNAGLIVERITSGYFDQDTGERKHGDPQIRVTAKGVERILDLHHPQADLAIIEGGA